MWTWGQAQGWSQHCRQGGPVSFASVAAGGQWPCLHLAGFPAWVRRKWRQMVGSQHPLPPAEEGKGPAAWHKQAWTVVCLKHYQKPREDPQCNLPCTHSLGNPSSPVQLSLESIQPALHVTPGTPTRARQRDVEEARGWGRASRQLLVLAPPTVPPEAENIGHPREGTWSQKGE